MVLLQQSNINIIYPLWSRRRLAWFVFELIVYEKIEVRHKEANDAKSLA